MPYACPIKQRESQRASRERHREKYKERHKEWRNRNKDKRKVYRKRYNDKKRHVIRNQKARRRARMLLATPKWLTACDNALMLEIYDMARKAGPQYQVDHIIPLRGDDVCGLHVPTNLQILPGTHNSRKGNTYEEPVWH